MMNAAMQAAIAAAAAQTDMTQAQAGGTDFEPPAKGLVRLRFISYIEIGVHTEDFKGQAKTRDKVILQFELSGPKHAPKDFDGKKVPDIITITETLSLNEKANFFKLFKRMNYDGAATHMAQLLGNEFLGTITHNERGEGTDKKVYANLRDDGGYTIRPPFVEDAETGDSRRISVDAPITPLKCFLWNYADKAQWDGIFIDGRWDDKKDDKGNVVKEGTSKNYFQNRIRGAKNFPDSPIAELIGGGDALDNAVGNAETPDRSEANKQASADAKAGASADPLAGV